jgi:hypothetical protein
MKSNATGQLFGYSLQFPRALLRLLEAKPGSKVGVEVCGDVSVLFPEGIILSEEDKSSLNNDTLADTSINLWKSFYNWIQAIETGELNPDNDKFILYTNHSVKTDSLVVQISEAITAETIEKVIAISKEKTQHITEQQTLYRFTDCVLNTKVGLFKKIIPQFELVSDNKADNVYDDIRLALRLKMINDENQVEYLLESLTGWLQKTIMERIAAKLMAVISYEEYEQHFQALFRSIHNSQELLDYAYSKMPTDDVLSAAAKQEPVYVKQLEAIKSTQPEIIEAVSDYFRADTNRQKWIESGLIDETAMEDFEGRLVSFHQIVEKRFSITEKDRPEEERGKLVLLDCQQRSEKIADKEPPNRTIQGSYHVLSDEVKVGWHPQWRVLFNDAKGEANG